MNEASKIRIFDKWANEGNCRVEVWRLGNGDIQIVFVDTQDAAPLASLTLTSYRADDLQFALEATR